MGLDYWLEMVDQKHRYGTNLLKYHGVWHEADTEENFFYWLDEGAGKSEDLEACPRDKLENQQLKYLSREQRYEYLIEVGKDGLLRWAKSGEKVTTHGPNKDGPNDGTSGETESESHITDDLHNARGILQAAGHSVPAPLAKLIERNQEKATWIFVCQPLWTQLLSHLLTCARWWTQCSVSTPVSKNPVVSNIAPFYTALASFLQDSSQSRMASSGACLRIVDITDQRQRTSGSRRSVLKPRA